MKATKRTKTAAKKAKSMKKGKSLESIKPLTKIAAAPAERVATPKMSAPLPFKRLHFERQQ